MRFKSPRSRSVWLALSAMVALFAAVAGPGATGTPSASGSSAAFDGRTTNGHYWAGGPWSIRGE